MWQTRDGVFCFRAGIGVAKCAAACSGRPGCTAFSYNSGGDASFKCGTFTGGTSDIVWRAHDLNWRSCVSEHASDGSGATRATSDNSQSVRDGLIFAGIAVLVCAVAALALKVKRMQRRHAIHRVAELSAIPIGSVVLMDHLKEHPK
jgi:hypothetical protein